VKQRIGNTFGFTLTVSQMLQRVTGDYCTWEHIDGVYRVIRTDSAGKEFQSVISGPHEPVEQK
jgi:hypothetical protein